MTISCARLGRIAGVVVTALSLTAALAVAASAATFTGQDAHARAVARTPAASGDVMCLDHGTPLPDPLPNGARVYLSQCQDGDPNQIWAAYAGEIIAYDTIGVQSPMCLDAGTPPRIDGGRSTCGSAHGNPNQTWVTDGGQIIVKDTLS